MNEQPEEALLLRVNTAAIMLAVSRSKVYELIAQGLIPHVRIGNILRIPSRSLRDWIEQKVTQHSEVSV
jgi:excisionase family DNA binding protein